VSVRLEESRLPYGGRRAIKVVWDIGPGVEVTGTKTFGVTGR
jgi:hypothetical protein